LLPPIHTYGGIHSEERKGRKSLFLFAAQLLRKTNLDPIFSKSRSGTIAHKNKKRITAGTHCGILQISLVWATKLSLAAIGLVFPALVLGYYKSGNS
jgi:hypothetical protein